MGLFKNTENYMLVVPKFGPNIGKNYVFKESSKRWGLLRHFVKNRGTKFINYPYFCVTGISSDGKWSYGNYSLSPTSQNLPLPEVIYDIKTDKMYVYEAHLWELNDYELLDINDPQFNTEP